MRRSSPRGIIAVAMVLSTAGCSIDDQTPGPTTTASAPRGVFEANAFTGRNLPIDDGSNFPDGARVERPGKVLTTRNCLSIGEVEDDASRPVLVAPAGSRIAKDGSAVTIEGLGTFRFGEALPAARVAQRTFTTQSLPKSLRGCGSLHFVFVQPR